MKNNMFKKAIGYVEKQKFLGVLTNINFISGNLTLVDDNEENEIVVSRDEVELMFEAFSLHDLLIFDKDILRASNNNLYLIELFEDGRVKFHLVDEKLQVVTSGDKFTPDAELIGSLEEFMTLEGNYHEVLATLPRNPEFNVQVVKQFDGTHFTYFYACNNKSEEQIDLIKVFHFGNQFFEEEYERITISYEEYSENIEGGILEEVSEQELHNYITGVTYGGAEKESPLEGIVFLEEDEEAVEEVELPEEEKNICNECGADLDVEDCDCKLWSF